MTLEYLRSIQQDLTPKQILNSGPHDRTGEREAGESQDKYYSLNLPNVGANYVGF